MPLSHLPVVTGSNLLGHARLFKDDRLRFLRTAGDTGPLARARFLRRWVVLVSSPELAREVLVERASSFEKSPAIRSSCATWPATACSRARGSSGGGSAG